MFTSKVTVRYLRAAGQRGIKAAVIFPSIMMILSSSKEPTQNFGINLFTYVVCRITTWLPVFMVS